MPVSLYMIFVCVNISITKKLMTKSGKAYSSKGFLEINLFSHLHDGDSIFFCKTDFLSSAFLTIKSLRHEVILITGNSDYEINDNTIKQAPENIKYWFSQNANSDNIFGIPMGLENSSSCKIEGCGHVWPHAPPKHDAILHAKAKTPTKDIYCNFSLSTNPQARKEALHHCVLNGSMTIDICQDHNQINQKKYSDYIDGILDHKMVVCPEGNGIDCHRVWETLLLGRVPIVKKSKVMNHFSDLPILFVDKWSEIEDLDLIKKKHELVKDNSTEKLNFKYWSDLILSYKSKLKNNHTHDLFSA